MNKNNENLTNPEEDVGVTKEYWYMPLFEEGSAELPPEDDFKCLTSRWDALTNHVVRIIGYADVEREDEQLARARAKVVQELLLQRGIAPERFDAVSWQVHGPPTKEEYRRQYRRASVLAYNAKIGPDDWQHYYGQLQHVHDTLDLGCSEDEVYDLILRVLYCRMLRSKERPEVTLGRGDWLIQCGVNHPLDVNKAALLCALLSEGEGLKDMWLQEYSLGILPLKRGVYDARLRSVEVGSSVEDLYALLGERAPRSYTKDAQRKRIVDFRYRGFGRDCWDYTLDAGSGIVVRVNLTTG
jgi:hypothetical protein